MSVVLQLRVGSPEAAASLLKAIASIADKAQAWQISGGAISLRPLDPPNGESDQAPEVRYSADGVYQESSLIFGDVTVDFASMSVRRANLPVVMTKGEFKLLRFFLENGYRVLTREELLTQVWGYRSYPSTRTVDNQVLKLRRKLEPDPAHPVHFLTVHGSGYRFVSAPAA